MNFLPTLHRFAWMAALSALCSSAAAQPVPFIRGDLNGDTAVDISDSIGVLGCLFLGDSCPACGDTGDANDDGVMDISDPIYILSFLFLDAPVPPPPYPDAGFDPTTGDPDACGDAPPGAEPGSIVISEIHYHPQSGDDSEEFIELYNRTDRRIDLGGFFFSKGVDFIFPPGTFIEAKGYLVTARDAARISQLHGISGVAGNYAGILDDGGETIRLKDAGGNTITEVTYDDGGGLWPRFADGYGSSLELIDLHGGLDSPQAWAASDESGKTAWQPFEIRQTAATSSQELHLELISEGECLVDDLIVLAANQNRQTNGSFENGMTGWLAQGTHRLSAVTDASASAGSRSLRIIATGRGDTSSNRIESDLTATINGGTAVTIRGSARWIRGSRFLLVRLHGNAVAQTIALNANAASGTPGKANTAARPNRGPDISATVHAPVLPAATQAITITSLISDVDGVASASLQYRVEPQTAFTTAAMGDAGVNGDAAAGDGIYTAVIPRQTSGKMIGFWIQAIDGQGEVSRFPADAPARTAMCRVGEPNPNSQLHRYHIWMPASTVKSLSEAPKMSNEMFDFTFVLDNATVFYNARIRYRGSPFIRSGPPTDPVGGRYAYNIEFGDHQKLNGTAEINLDNLEPGRDPTIQRERTAYMLYKELGLPHSEMEYVRLWFNGNDHGIYANVEKIDNDYVKAHWPEDSGGNLHKMDDYFEFDDNFGFSNRDARLTNYGAKKEEYRWNFEKRDTDRNDDFTAVQDLVRLMNATGAAYESSVEKAIDPEQWARVLAVRRIIGDWDSFGYSRGKNMYMYRPPLEGRWKLVPWDMDFLLGNGDSPSAPLFGGLDPTIDAFLAYPKYKRLYLQAFRDLVDGPFRNEFLDPKMDEFYNFLRRETSVSDPGSIKSFITQRRNYILSQLPSDQVVILTNNGADFSTSETSVTIEGDAPLDVVRFRLNGASLVPALSGISKWAFTRSIPLGATTFVVEGLNEANQTVGTDSISILRVVPCIPASIEPAAIPRGPVTLTLHGSGFQPGSSPRVTLASASTETGFRAFYKQTSGPFGDINQAEAFLNTAGGAVRTLTTAHQTISLRTEGGGEIFPTQTFPAPWNVASVDNLAARYSGYIHAPSAGPRTFGVNSDDGFRLRIEGAVVAEYPPPRGPGVTLGIYNFPAAGTYRLQLDWYENGGGDIVQFFQESVSGSQKLINGGSELTVTLDDPTVIEGTGVQVLDANTLTADFDLTGVDPGAWNLEMAPEEGSTCRLAAAVTVQ